MRTRSDYPALAFSKKLKSTAFHQQAQAHTDISSESKSRVSVENHQESLEK